MSYNGFADMGVDLTDVSTTPKFERGAIAVLNGNEYVYAQAGSAIAAGDFLVVDVTSASEPFVLIPSSAVNQAIEAIAPVAIASGSYGWVLTRGSTTGAKVEASTAANAQLGSSATAGTLSTITISASPTQAEVQRVLAAASGKAVIALDAESGGVAEVQIK